MADTSLSEKKIGLLVWQTSNFWQSKLRRILKKYSLSLNEYLILESINTLEINMQSLSQTSIYLFAGIDESVISVNLKSLELKKFIGRKVDEDNRKKIIFMLSVGRKLFKEINPKINQEEINLFDKLQSEKLNFINSLKLILGKKIRIKVKKNI